ncbi:MAG: Cytochrome c bioproteinis transmembrane [Beijerinckiaceae bacterium]|nr:MAG: Cytochrome c bioproteinis transmembrane [Beijerinckiaceae bacterium]
MDFGTLSLAFGAGVLSILSPCVLPLLPIVLGTASAEHRAGPLVLAAGLAASFVAIGVFVATIGFSIGLDTDVFRLIAAILLIGFSFMLAIPSLQQRFALAAGPIGSWVETRFGGFSISGLKGQFGVGLLLGAVWTPCVGPTLGAAMVLASQGKSLCAVTLTMIAFGIGSALPLILLGMLSRSALQTWRGRLMGAGSGIKLAFAALLFIVGMLILTGYDKRIETTLIQASPDWLTNLTTRF